MDLRLCPAAMPHLDTKVKPAAQATVRNGLFAGGSRAIKWTRLSCRSFAANAVRLQLHALAYNLGNFMRTLATNPARPISGDYPARTRHPEIRTTAQLIVGIPRPPVIPRGWGIRGGISLSRIS